MFRCLKALSLTLALAALSLFAGSCGNNGSAQIRFVHAIQDAPALDIDVNGTQKFNNISFLGVLPNQPGYTTVPSGTDTLAGLVAGSTTQVFSSTVGWSSATSYTVIGTGFSKTGMNGSNVVLLSIPDHIPTPPADDVEFRVIHASPSGPGTVDVYIKLNPSTGPTLPVTIPGLAYTQSSSYININFNPNSNPIPPGYTVYVTASGSTTPIITQQVFPANAGAARTFILTDVQGGNSMSTSLLELSDLH
ncbi:MAG: DUF4397 domain-containing protein [Terriglobales bacterium]